ncbi:MAG TPA: Flp pilus assembly protein CpaB [Actinomycetota bacterium]|nr:Flp pilus assembly protein CpaB [Actinomycetota bacterium]
MLGRRIWSRSSRLYLGASVVLAALAGAKIQTYANHAGRAAEPSGPLTRVAVAAEPVHRGDAVTASSLRLLSMPAAYAPPGAVGSIDEAAGRVALTDLAPGEVVTDTRLVRVRAGPVASLVPPGLRAFAVPTTLPPSIVRQGDHVDILATYGSGGSQPRTETVVQGVEILLVLGEPGAAGGDRGGFALDLGAADISQPAVLIVLVAPEQEERLAFARAFANLEVAVAPAEEPSSVPFATEP